MKCVDNCPTGALSLVGKAYTAREVMEVIEQDVPFYETSGGGVTLSGGEPLLQPEFALAILKESKRKKIHTTLDTCGKASPKVVKKVLPYVDLVLFDVKHVDPTAHDKGTGSDNKLIMDNLHYISDKVDIWLRVPLIPEFNDDKNTIQKIINLARNVSFKKLCFLPYHQWGSGKYGGLGRKYPLQGAQPISKEKLDHIAKLCDDNRIGNYEIVTE